MSSGNLDEQFDDYTPEVSDKEVADALRQEEPAPGVYLMRSLGAVKSISKVEKGKGLPMAVETIVLLRPSDKQPHSYKFKKWHMLPIIPRAQWLAAVGYEGFEDGQVVPDSQIAKILANFDADGPSKTYLNKWRSRLRAGFGRDAYQDYPRSVKDSGGEQFTLPDGTLVGKEEAAAFKNELIRNIKLAAHSIMKDGSVLKGQEFYSEISFQTDKEGKRKSDLPGADWFYSIDNPPKVKDSEELKEILDPFKTVK